MKAIMQIHYQLKMRLINLRRLRKKDLKNT